MTSSILIDTHILIWDQLDPSRLTAKAKKSISVADSEYSIIVPEIALWEIAMLMKKKRLIVNMPYADFMHHILLVRNYVLQGLNPEIAGLAAELSLPTNDPADKIIVATSMVLDLPLVTADTSLRDFPLVRTIW